MRVFRTMLAGGLGLLPLLLGVASFASAGTIVPYAVNNSGLIVGEYFGGTLPVGFVYNPATTTYTYFNPNLPGVTSSAAVGINDSGQISGSYTTSSGNFGFLDNAGIYTAISAPGAVQSKDGNSSYILFDGGGTVVAGINNSGVMVGNVATGSGLPGFIDSGGTFTEFSYPSAVLTNPYGINDSGIVSGTAAFVSHGVETRIGFLYNTNTSTFTPIMYPGATNTVVQGINDSGEVVGFYILAGQTSGFTYLNGVYSLFPFAGANLTEPFGISNNGTISGIYTCPSGPCTSDPAFSATPTADGYSFTTLPSAIPEPGSSVMLGSGLMALLTVASRTGRKRRAENCRCFRRRRENLVLAREILCACVQSPWLRPSSLSPRQSPTPARSPTTLISRLTSES